MSSVFKIGEHLAVHIPQHIVERLGIVEGSEVEVTLNPETGAIMVRNAAIELNGVDQEFVQHIDEFIEQYRPALEALARR